MKKSLVLAMAMALGVSATAFAANPFSDVPAGHWAYASVAKLAAAGIGDDGWAATVYYKGANPMDKGSWGAYATYYDQSGAVLLDSICEL